MIRVSCPDYGREGAQDPAYKLVFFLHETCCVKAQQVSLFLCMPRILIIEDEASIRAVLKDILLDQTELKLEVDEAKDGAEGLAQLEANSYDLALCDIKMPKMDGMDVLQKAMDKNIHTPFIMISAHGTTEMAVDAIKMGAYDFLQKPPDLNRLLITVRNALDRNTLVKETK
jgi:two-component system nitrogen regulation response regulator NtrX